MKSVYPDVETTIDYHQLLSDPEIDAIAVATPVHLHHQLAKEALDAGKHVFIEKPMAASVAECEDLIKRAEAADLRLMVGHTFIYSETIRKIKEIVDSGELGDVLYISSRRLNLGLFQKDINVAWDLAPHDLSIILYIMGEEPLAVNCQGKDHVTKGVEDVTNISLEFSGHRFAMIQSSWLDPNKVRDMTIVGSLKMIAYNDMEPIEKLKIYNKRVDVPPHYDTFAEFQYSYHYGEMCAPYLKHVEPLKVLCEHFVDCIITGERPLTDGRDGLCLVRILEAASESLKNEGGRVELQSACQQ